MQNNHRQGDISLHPIIDDKVEFYDHTEAIDMSKLKRLPLKGTRFVVAIGEASGHNHALLDVEDSKVEVYQDEQGRYIMNILSPLTLAHVLGDSTQQADHKPQTIGVGWFVQESEEEFDPFALQVRRVVD